jgi:acyl dehydratase
MTTTIPWSIVARNLPEHETNPIHTDAGAQAAGFERALVAGVTSYAYCVHPVVEHFGVDWVEHGASEVRFRAPVFDGDLVSFPVSVPVDVSAKDSILVSAMTERSPNAHVAVRAWRERSMIRERTERELDVQLQVVEVDLVGEFGSTYAARAGDDLVMFQEQGIVHPAVWTALANRVFHAQLAKGSWIHTRSLVAHHGLAVEGDRAVVETVVVKRMVGRSGERAIADVTIRVNDQIVATLEHEAIIDLQNRTGI